MRETYDEDFEQPTEHRLRTVTTPGRYLPVRTLWTLLFIILAIIMEEGGKTKKTIFVGGIGEDVDEQVILETFSTFGGSC
jgi:hypothetical protein